MDRINARLNMIRAYQAKWDAKKELERQLRDKRGGITTARNRHTSLLHECLRAELQVAKLGA